MNLRHLFAMSLLSISAAASADMIDINLRDTSAQMQYKASMGGGRDKSVVHMGVLYNSNNSAVADFGLMVKNEVGGDAPGVSVGVGIKGVVVRAKPTNQGVANLPAMSMSAVALGGQIRYSPYASRLAVVGGVYVSPNITTFGDGTRYLESGAGVEYEIMPEASVYAGYRKISFTNKINTTGVETRVDEGAHVGVRLSF